MPLEQREYRVTWTIDVSAHSPRAAAQQAIAYQRDPRTDVSCFDVALRGDPFAEKVEIDLTYDEDPYEGLIEPCPFCGYLQCSEHMELRDRI